MRSDSVLLLWPLWSIVAKGFRFRGDNRHDRVLGIEMRAGADVLFIPKGIVSSFKRVLESFDFVLEKTKREEPTGQQYMIDNPIRNGGRFRTRVPMPM